MGSLATTWKGKTAWWLYNLFLTTKAVFTAPAWVPVVVAVAKRRHSFAGRLGLRGPQRFRGGRPIWIHALSVGEVRSAEPLVRHLAGAGTPLVVTASTRSGFGLARNLFAGLDLPVAYFPYDFVFSVRHAVSRLRPAAVVIVETDIWPNFLAEMKRRSIPVYLVNGRISDRSFRRFGRLGKLAGHLFSNFTTICMQTDDDARRLLALGVPPSRIRVTGNLKFDLALPSENGKPGSEMRRRWNLPADRSLIVIGSSHPGEEEIIVNALEPLVRGKNGACLVVAPRDVRRAAGIAERLRKEGFAAGMIGSRTSAGRDPQVLVVDRFGILRHLYALADAAVIGGSFVPAGGHNPVEAAALGCPVIFGPDMSDFRQIAALLKEAGAAFQVQKPEKLNQVVARLLSDRNLAARMGQRGQRLVAENRGAVEKTIQALQLNRAASDRETPSEA